MDLWIILIFVALLVIVAILGCHIATYLGMGFTGMFQNYINRYIDSRLKERIKSIEKKHLMVEGIQSNRFEKFAVEYSNNYEIKDAWSEFNDYLVWNSNRLNDIKSKLNALSNMRKMMGMTSGGTELWFSDRRPGLTKFSR